MLLCCFIYNLGIIVGLVVQTQSFAVHGSNLLWQVTKIIRHLQALNSQIPLISVTIWVSFLIPANKGGTIISSIASFIVWVLFLIPAIYGVSGYDVDLSLTSFIARVSFLIPVWEGMLKTLSVLYAQAYDAGCFSHRM